MRPSEVMQWKREEIIGAPSIEYRTFVTIETSIEMAQSYSAAVLINSIERLAWEHKFKEWRSK